MSLYKIITIVFCVLAVYFFFNLEPTKKTIILNRALQESLVTAGDVQGESGNSLSYSEGGVNTSPSPNQTIESKIRKAFPECPDVMVAIAKAESRLNPKAKNVNRNGSTDKGLFQINSVHGYSEDWLEDVDNNILAARSIYDKQGLNAWVAYNSGKYIAFKQ